MTGEEERGTFRCYDPSIRFNKSGLEEVARANKIIDEYRSDGDSLTLRQLYYQHVARGFIENTPESYRNLGVLVSRGRLAGLIDWLSIEDRTRNLMGLQTWTTPEAALKEVRDKFKIDLWEEQPMRPEVWVEKEALSNVVGQICSSLRVDFFACRGYVSQSEQWRAGRRLAGYVAHGQRPVVFHLGDHDPSGIDMTRDNVDRLSMFAGVSVTVVRLALNMEQVVRYRPPPNPAKVRDARFAAYEKKFGDESWELDALDPPVIRALIEDAVNRIRDERLWDEALGREAAARAWLDAIVDEGGGQ